MKQGIDLKARIVGILVSAASVTAFAPSPSQADSIVTVGNEGTLIQSQAWASTAANQTPTTVTGTGASGPAAAGQPLVTVSDLTGNGTATTNYGFSQSYTNPTGSFASGTGPLANGNNYGFVNSYVIDVPASTAGAYLFSLNLNAGSGLDNLTARLYEYTANGLQNLTLGVTGAVNSSLPDSWSASTNGYVANTTLAPLQISSGEYVLEVAGIETGTNSGLYSGQLSITPVPLPATLPLLLSGCAGILGFARRRASLKLAR